MPFFGRMMQQCQQNNAEVSVENEAVNVVENPEVNQHEVKENVDALKEEAKRCRQELKAAKQMAKIKQSELKAKKKEIKQARKSFKKNKKQQKRAPELKSEVVVRVVAPAPNAPSYEEVMEEFDIPEAVPRDSLLSAVEEVEEEVEELYEPEPFVYAGALESLVAMGFPEETSKAVLIAVNGDVLAAITTLTA